MVHTYISQDFRREIFQFELSTTQRPRQCVRRETPKFLCSDNIRNVVGRLFGVVFVIEIRPFSCYHDQNQF